MNELSPRKFPRSPIRPPKTPPQWKKPQDIMKKHKIRLKQNALLARMNRSPTQVFREPEPTLKTVPTVKRKNPFKRDDGGEVNSKKVKDDEEVYISARNANSSLLDRLGLSNGSQEQFFQLPPSTLLSQTQPDVLDDETSTLSCKLLPVDWTLRSKMRFISIKPFPWSQTLKTCEEASGVTGFVRCLESGDGPVCADSSSDLDTSPNARFHQCCLFWQHPSLAWIDVFPRHRQPRTDSSKHTPIAALPHIRDALHRDWSESFRSLFQLVRARHCPYFYMVANTFTCLFRAAGISSCTQTNVSICPTTRGFRKMLEAEGINYTMPLRPRSSRPSKENTSDEEAHLEEDEDGNEEDIEDGGKDWLASLGIEEAEINKISTSQDVSLERLEQKLAGSQATLVHIEGGEAQILFNLLINSRSITPTTGSFSGVPPTLLSPVAFLGGSLTSLKVRESTVKLENERYFSMEFKGPILPHIVHNLCQLLQYENEKFSVTLANIDSSKAFTLPKDEKSPADKEASSTDEHQPGQAFSVQSLSDCGLPTHILTTFCSDNMQSYDSIKCTDGLFVYS